MTNEDIQLTGSSFASLSGYIWKPDTEPRALIVMEHGIGEHIGIYKEWAEKFCEQGFIFSGFDLRGHGLSSGKRGHTPGHAAIDDLHVIIQYLQSQFPELPLFLYGHSLGGNLVLYYAITHQPDIAGIIASSPTIQIDPPSHHKIAQFAGLLANMFPKATFKIGLHAKDLTQREAEAETPPQSSDSENEETSSSSLMNKHSDEDPLLHQLMSVKTYYDMVHQAQLILEAPSKSFTTPVLLMHGVLDTLALPLGSVQLASRIGKKAHLKLWNNAKHELHREACQEEVLQYVIHWIESQLPKVPVKVAVPTPEPPQADLFTAAAAVSPSAEPETTPRAPSEPIEPTPMESPSEPSPEV